MKTIYQIFGVALGWTIGGPIGAIIGASLGSLLHSKTSTEEPRPKISGMGGRTASNAGDFHVSLLVLSALVIKADGRVAQSELDYVRKRFVEMFGKDRANESFKLFKNIIDQDINTSVVCTEIRKHTSHAMRLQLVHFLFQVAQADGHIHDAELNIIHRISSLFYIRKPDYDSIKAMFVKLKTTNNYYQILEIKPTASEKEIKSSYRKMVKKYHPDKLVGLGEDVIKAGQEKFVQVQQAYDEICKQRGIS